LGQFNSPGGASAELSTPTKNQRRLEMKKEQIHQSVREFKDRKREPLRSPFFYIGLAAIVLVILLAYTTSSANQALNSAAGGAFSANPELFAAQRFAEEAVNWTASSYLAANPEISAARRYGAVATTGSERDFLATNPELSVARRDIEKSIAVTDEINLYQNPEIKVALSLGSAVNASASRWEAIAKHNLGSAANDSTSFDAADASASRWEAMTKHYLGSAANASTSRWEAIAKHYSADFSNYRFIMIQPGFWARQAP
jgi:hypothetical protein